MSKRPSRLPVGVPRNNGDVGRTFGGPGARSVGRLRRRTMHRDEASGGSQGDADWHVRLDGADARPHSP